MIPINTLAGIISQNGIPVPIIFPTNNKYRFQQSLLFQRAHTKSIPFIYTNHLGQSVDTGTRYYFDGQSGNFNVGPNSTFVCSTSRWSWKYPNVGDWLDANAIQQGATPFAQSALLANGLAAGIITIDITTAMQYVYTNNRWCAFLLRFTGPGEASFVGPCNLSATKSILQVNYTDGSSETLQNWVTSALRPSTAYTDAMNDTITGGNIVIEFFRPTTTGKTVASANMLLSHMGVGFGSTRINVFVCAPTVPNLTQIPGLAQNYDKDSGIATHPSVIVNQLVTDSTGIYDVLDIYNSGSYSNPYVPGNTPTIPGPFGEGGFDPTLWGTPGVGHMAAVAMPTQGQLDNLYPRKGFGKWVGATYPNYFRVVHSNDTQALASGFTPLATGLGAIELTMPGRNIPNGGSWFASGEAGTNVDLLFDRARIGQVSEIYIRYYVQLGSGWEAKDSDFRMHFMGPYQEAGKFPEQYGANPQTMGWRATDFTGKFFGGAQHIAAGRAKHYTYPTRQRPDGTPDDSFTYPVMGGGYGATSGALGYQGRCMFQQGFFKENFPGPAIGGMAWGIEMYDFQDTSAIPSQSFISGWDAGPNSFAGANGGIGFLYPGKWYCLELRWKLNTLAPYTLPPRGTDYRESGFLQDGFLEYYVDGILANTSPTFATRRNPILDWAVQVANGVPEPFDTDGASPHYKRPMTNVSPENWMGFATLAGNLYYGGRSPNPRDKKVYINGIVASTSYVGPMKGVSRDNGGLGVTVTPPPVTPPSSGSPAWVNALSANTWTQIPNTGLTPWINAGGIADAGYIGSNWKDDIVTSFSSPVFDTPNYEAYICGGGHSANSYNGVIKFNYKTLTYSVVVSPTPPSKYPPAYLSNMAAGSIYPSGAGAPFNATFKSDLTDPRDTSYNAPEPAPIAFHSYATLTHWTNSSGAKMISADYYAAADANLNTGKWVFASGEVYAPQLEALGLGYYSLQQNTKSHYDSVTGHRFVTCTRGDAGFSVRNHLLEINPNTHTIIAAHAIPVNMDPAMALCAKGRKIWIFPKVVEVAGTSGSSPLMSMNTAMAFDMDTHAVTHYTISGDGISFYNYFNAQDISICADSGDANTIYRWNHGAEPNAIYILNTIVLSGAGTIASPYVIAQTRKTVSGMADLATWQYRMHYVAEWGVLMVLHGPLSGWYALKLS